MKKTTITISFDEEKMSALKMYLEQSKRTAEDELEKALETLYQKTGCLAACGKVRAKDGETPAGSGSGEIRRVLQERLSQ